VLVIGAGSGASLSGTNLTLTVALTFQPGFPGAKNGLSQRSRR
jgi:hypothetical protein